MHWVTLILFVSLAAAPSAASTICRSLEACISKYPEIAKTEAGISKREGDLARTVQTYGQKAIPDLIRLLEHEDEGVRRLAGYTLRDISGLGPEDLEELIRARDAGDGWIPPAIASIGTPEAVAYLADDLRKRPQIHTQVTYAFKTLGAKGAPAIAELFACTNNCNEKVFFAASFVLHELGDEAIGVVPRLLEIASDYRFTIEARSNAVAAIGDIGSAGTAFEAQLLDLKIQDPSLAASVNQALYGIGSSEAVPSLVNALAHDPEGVLGDLRELGRHGYDAGPAVLEYLNSPDWDIRVLAADVLGHLRYSPASSLLSASLNNQDDWKLVYASSFSLARLSEETSIGDLELVRANYWYPPVRAAADAAIKHILSGAPLEDNGWWRFSTARNSPETCSQVNLRRIEEPSAIKVYASNDSKGLKKLAYETAVYSYDAPEGTEPHEAGGIEVRPETMVESVERFQQAPDFALKISNGWLAGSDRGEWGGELVYISEPGESVTLYDGNVEDIFQLADKRVATAGLAHLGLSAGWLLRIDETTTAQYSVTTWKRLPGAPASSWLVEGDRLLVNTYGGGSVLVGRGGEMRMAECVSE